MLFVRWMLFLCIIFFIMEACFPPVGESRACILWALLTHNYNSQSVIAVCTAQMSLHSGWCCVNGNIMDGVSMCFFCANAIVVETYSCNTFWEHSLLAVGLCKANVGTSKRKLKRGEFTFIFWDVLAKAAFRSIHLVTLYQSNSHFFLLVTSCRLVKNKNAQA